MSAHFSYSICVRQEEDYCCIQYSLCSDTNSWSLDNAIDAMAETDTECDKDYVGIDGVSSTCNSDAVLQGRLCGDVFNAMSGDVKQAGFVCGKSCYT